MKVLFYVISQKIDQKCGEKASDHVCFNEIDQFYTFFLCMVGKNSVYEAPPYFLKILRLFQLVKNYYYSWFFSNIFTNSWNIYKSKQSCMALDSLLKKFRNLLK